MKHEDREKMQELRSSRQILFILTVISAAFIVGAAAAGIAGGSVHDIIPGLIRINTWPSQFTRDYFKLGGAGGAFLNTGLIGLACCAMLAVSRARCTGLTVAAYFRHDLPDHLAFLSGNMGICEGKESPVRKHDKHGDVFHCIGAFCRGTDLEISDT